ncbi:ABC transporter substrate-binding protein [Caldimonas tepidiphila]|uniref:ABC transporter substrate-binding protein n=1 Tax=Caldimonas tepidiphila TaxID=2315841 RepID=UPI001F0C02D3|nr:ABC transporter substrate-binding protein [Caldimonas tepidiphila]
MNISPASEAFPRDAVQSPGSAETGRRRFLLGATALAAGLGAPALVRAAGATLRLGQSTDLTGPLSELGQALHHGARACFAEVNARGGVHGQQIVLETLDDAYDVKRGIENARRLLADPDIFGLFNCFGTPMVEATLPMIRGTDVPYFAPLSGALLARPRDMRNVLNVRASYADETEKLVNHLTPIGYKRVAVAYQNNSFGKEVLESTRLALKKRGLDLAVAAPVESSGEDAGMAAQKISGANPDVVMLGLAGKPTAAFIRNMRQLRRGIPLYALSVMGSSATLKELGNEGVGVTVAQVMPLPTKATMPIVREYAQAWRAAKVALPLSHSGLEGYVNARAFVEILRRAGPKPTRTAFLNAAWNLRTDLGGFDVGFSDPGSSASRFVELTMITGDGNFIA